MFRDQYMMDDEILMERTVREIVFVLLEDFPRWECAKVMYFITVLGRGLCQVKTAGLRPEKRVNTMGLEIVVDYDIEEAVGRGAGVVLVGGDEWQTDPEAKRQMVLPLMDDAIARGCTIGGIGAGVDMLGTFGILNDIPHTADSISSLVNYSKLTKTATPYSGEEHFLDVGAVRSGNIVTGKAVGNLPFARAMVWTMDVDQEQADQMYMDHAEGYAYAPINLGDTVVSEM